MNVLASSPGAGLLGRCTPCTCASLPDRNLGVEIGLCRPSAPPRCYRILGIGWRRSRSMMFVHFCVIRGVMAALAPTSHHLAVVSVISSLRVACKEQLNRDLTAPWCVYMKSMNIYRALEPTEAQSRGGHIRRPLGCLAARLTAALPMFIGMNVT